MAKEEKTSTEEKKDWSYVSKETLVDWLTTNKKNDTIIIDVRDQDFGTHCIKDAKHHPFGNFESNVDGIVPLYQNTPNVVFHCTHSQVRGPTAANCYAQLRKKYGEYPSQNIYVLSGGFHAFSSTYSPDQRQDLFSTTNDKKDDNEKEEKQENGEDKESAVKDKEEENVDNEDIRYISGNTLAEWLSDESMTKKIQIIDVRDDDFVDYQINTAINHPSHHFDQTTFVDSLIDTYKDKEYLIFHCAYSQQRGPRAAEIYRRIRFPSSSKHKYSSYPKQTICILEHGFRGFLQTHKEHCVPIKL